MAEEKYNMKNPSVKRILQEVKEMQSNPSDDFMSLPLEENIFEWQFAIFGPRDSEFEGGIYHGRIQLPAEYPLKPPAFLLLTPNGRFETQTKICLSISNHHPEHWQPSWSVRSALLALIAFMPTNPEGALGSLDFKKEDRRLLATKSRESPPKYGTTERQNLINEIHQYMLTKAPPISQSNTPTSIAVTETEENMVDARVPDAGGVGLVEEDIGQVQFNANADPFNANADPFNVRFSAGLREVREASPERRQLRTNNNTEQVWGRISEDRMYTLAAMVLTIAILILLVKKYLKSVQLAGFQDDS